MIVYRLSRKQYINDLSGEGARLAGGRWNSRGRHMLYTSQSVALCMVEVAVHLPYGMVPKDYYLAEIFVPDDIEVLDIDRKALPINWANSLHAHGTQEIGDRFLATCIYLGLKMPSAVVPMEYNILINPQHPRHKEISIKQITPFDFDSRLFVKSGG